MSIDIARVRLAFERAVSTYDASAVLQREISDRMLERLDYVKIAPQTLLDAGCGTGYALRPLAALYPEATIVALDISQGMLRRARDKPNTGDGFFGSLRARFSPRRIIPVCADVAALPIVTGSLDFIWSNLTLQWCNDPPKVFSELYRVLATDGLVMFSTFGPDTLKELRSAFSEVDSGTHVSRFVDMHDIGDMLIHAGFADPVVDMEMITLTYDRLEAVMRDLKAIGAHNANSGRSRGLTGKSQWGRLRRAYERFRVNGRLPATFEIVYGHAWKPKRKVTSEGHAIVQIVKRPR